VSCIISTFPSGCHPRLRSRGIERIRMDIRGLLARYQTVVVWRAILLISFGLAFFQVRGRPSSYDYMTRTNHRGWPWGGVRKSRPPYKQIYPGYYGYTPRHLVSCFLINYVFVFHAFLYYLPTHLIPKTGLCFHCYIVKPTRHGQERDPRITIIEGYINGAIFMEKDSNIAWRSPQASIRAPEARDGYE